MDSLRHKNIPPDIVHQIADAQLGLHEASHDFFRSLPSKLKSGMTQEDIVKLLQEGTAELTAHHGNEAFKVAHSLTEQTNIRTLQGTPTLTRVFAGGKLWGKTPIAVVGVDGTLWIGTAEVNLKPVVGGFAVFGKLQQVLPR